MKDKPFADAPRVEGRVIYGWWPDCEAWFPLVYRVVDDEPRWDSADGHGFFTTDDNPFTHYREWEAPK